MAQVYLIPAANGLLTNTASANKSQTGATGFPQKRKVRRYDPEEEIAALRTRLDEERTKRRELESEIFKLKQERTEMCIKMSRLEQSKISTNIPQSLVPMLADAMAHGVNPSALSEANRPLAANKFPVRPAAKPTPARSLAATAKNTPTATAAPKTATPTSAQKVATPAAKPVTATLPVTAAAGQKFLIQQKTADGKVVSFLASVAPSNGNTPTTGTTTAAPATAEKTDNEPSTSAAGDAEASSSAAPAQTTSADTEQISPESPPPEAATISTAAT